MKFMLKRLNFPLWTVVALSYVTRVSSDLSHTRVREACRTSTAALPGVQKLGMLYKLPKLCETQAGRDSRNNNRLTPFKITHFKLIRVSKKRHLPPKTSTSLHKQLTECTAV